MQNQLNYIKPQMEKPREVRKEREKGPDNEVRVNNTTYTRTYLAYIAHLFQDKHDKVIIKAMGFAIPRSVALAMLVRRRFKGLHQIVEVSATDLTDQDRTRRVGLITITLSKKELDKNHIGYAAPLPDSEVEDYKPFVPGQAPPTTAPTEEGTGMRGGRFRPPTGDRGRGRGRGRGRFMGRRGGFRGRRGGYEGGNGGYGGYEQQQEEEGGDYGYGAPRGRGGFGFRGRRGFRGGRFGGRRGGFREPRY